MIGPCLDAMTAPLPGPFDQWTTLQPTSRGLHVVALLVDDPLDEQHERSAALPPTSPNCRCVLPSFDAITESV